MKFVYDGERVEQKSHRYHDIQLQIAVVKAAVKEPQEVVHKMLYSLLAKSFAHSCHVYLLSCQSVFKSFIVLNYHLD